MYNGKSFERDQLIFVVTTIVHAAIDRMDAMADSQNDESATVGWIKEVVGLQLATMAAQITNKGMAIQDALAIGPNFDNYFDNFVPGSFFYKLDKIQQYSEQWVDVVFS